MATIRDAQTLLNNYRTRYPLYKDVDDEKLLSAIQKKYPQYKDVSLSTLPRSENLLQQAIRNSSPSFGSEASKVGFQTAQGVIGNAPQNIAENPMTTAISGIPGVQAKAGAQGITGLKKFIFGGKSIEPETTKFSEKYMEPQTFEGKVLGTAGNILGGTVTPGIGIAKGLGKVKGFPYNTVMKMRRKIPKWVSSKSTEYGSKLDELLSKSDSLIPAEESSIPFKNVIENQDLFGKLSSKVQSAITDLYEEYATRPSSVDPKEFITAKQKLSKLIPKSPKFDVNEHALLEITKGVGSITERYVKGISKLNKEYSGFFKTRGVANKVFQPWKSEYETERGERILSNPSRVSTGLKRGLESVEKETGQKFLGKAKARENLGTISKAVGIGGPSLLGIDWLLKKVSGR